MFTGLVSTQCRTRLLFDHNSDEAGLVTGVPLLSPGPRPAMIYSNWRSAKSRLSRSAKVF